MGILHCPHCRQAVQAAPEHAGMTVACPACQGQFQLPPPAPIARIPQGIAVAVAARDEAPPIENFRPASSSYKSSYRPSYSQRERGPQNSPGLAAVLSFLFLGLGQIYNGNFGMALLLFVLWFLLVVVTLVVWPAVVITGPLLFLLWLYGMVEAYHGAESYNRWRR